MYSKYQNNIFNGSLIIQDQSLKEYQIVYSSWRVGAHTWETDSSTAL